MGEAHSSQHSIMKWGLHLELPTTRFIFLSVTFSNSSNLSVLPSSQHKMVIVMSVSDYPVLHV